MTWTFHLGDLDSADVQSLLSLHLKSTRSCSPEISFWSLREDGLLLGFGALKQLSPDRGEVKSMRTAAHALGRGVGTAMLHHIVTEARRRGYRSLSLETGSTQPFAAALRLYTREGFASSEAFGDYSPTPFTRFFTLALD